MFFIYPLVHCNRKAYVTQEHYISENSIELGDLRISEHIRSEICVRLYEQKENHSFLD